MPSAVIVPACPALIPAAAGRTPELEDMRRTAREAVIQLLASDPRRVAVIADAERGADESALLDLSGLGIALGPGDGRSLPLPFAPAGWLLDEAGWTGPRAYVRPTWIADAEDDAFLVVADGTACRTDRAPGHLDPRAERVDERLADALATGDLAVLDELGDELTTELMVAGLPALRWLRNRTAGRSVSAEVPYVGAPLGVGSWVARWTWSEPAA